MGGIFAVSTVIPGKIQHLASQLTSLKEFSTDGILEQSLQVLGCFLLLSVLIWSSHGEGQAVRPLLAYPPHNRESVLAHITGLVVGVWLLLAR